MPRSGRSVTGARKLIQNPPMQAAPTRDPDFVDLLAKARHLEREGYPREAQVALAVLRAAASNAELSRDDEMVLCEIASDAAFVRAAYAESLVHVSRWEVLAKSGGATHCAESALALCDVHRARILYQQGNYSQARKRASEAALRALGVGDYVVAARARMCESYVAHGQRDDRAARELLIEAVRFAETGADAYVLAFVLNSAGQHRMHVAAALTPSNDNVPPPIANSPEALQALAESEQFFDRGLVAARACGAEDLSRMIEFNRMRSWLVAGRAAPCIAPIKRLLRDYQARGLIDNELSIRVALARALRLIGNHREAMRQANAGLAVARRFKRVNLSVQNLQRERAWADTALRAQPEHAVATEPVYLALADAYIDAHPAGGVTLGDLAAACGVGMRSLQLAFQRHRGISPIAAARDKRLDFAAAALDTGDETVAAVAARYGFHSATTFANEFKRRFGMTPRQRLLARRRQPR
jgi:AraC-like DNA-binding protein